MSKNVLFVGILFSLALSVMITQEANALINSPGQFSHTTAGLGPSKTCGDHICQSGENSKWLHAVLTSQRQGPSKATGGYNGMVIMHQLVVNSVAKSDHGNSIISPSQGMGTMNSPKVNATGSK